jgi:hypothetical protein
MSQKRNVETVLGAATAALPMSSKRREALGVGQYHVPGPNMSALSPRSNPYSNPASGYETEELRAEMEQLRREVENIRNMTEPLPGYA